MKTYRSFFLLFLVFLGFCPVTGIAFTLKPALNLSVSLPQLSPEASGTETLKKTGLLGGVLFELPLFPFVSLDTGAILHPYGMGVKDSATQINVESKWKNIQIPIGLRLRLIPFLNLALGGYYGFAVGTNSDVVVTIPGIEPASSQVPLTSEQKSDYGLYSSVSLEFPLFPTASVFLDGRYLMGLKNQSSTSGSTLKFNHFQFLSGISFDW